MLRASKPRHVIKNDHDIENGLSVNKQMKNRCLIQESPPQTCKVCYCEKTLNVKLQSCGHIFCEECVVSHIKHFMENNLSTLAPKCLNYLCKIEFTEDDI